MSDTYFETKRGISDVEVSYGHAWVVVSSFPKDSASSRRIQALQVLKESGISIDFLKLSFDGFSFVVPEAMGTRVQEALCSNGFDAKVLKNRAIIEVSAPSIREEEGLIARIAEFIVRNGANIDSVGDMHSAVLVVVDADSAERAANELKKCIGEVDFV